MKTTVLVNLVMLLVLLTTSCINCRDLIGSGDEERIIRVIAALIGAWIFISIGAKGEKPSGILIIMGVALFLYG